MRILFFLLSLCPFPALAQTSWTTVTRGGTDVAAAQVCAVSDAMRSFCFEVGCNSSGGTVLSLTLDGVYLADASIATHISIDGQSIGRLGFHGTELDEGRTLMTLLSEENAAGLKRALKRSSRAAFHLDDSFGRETLAFTLRGSSAAISRSEATCPEPSPTSNVQTGETVEVSPQDSMAQTQLPVANASRIEPVEDDPAFTAQLSRDLGVSSSEMSSVVFANDVGALGFLYHFIEGSAGSMALSVAYYGVDESEYAFQGVVSDLYGTSPRNVRITPEATFVTTTMLRDGDPRCCPTGSATWLIDPRDLSVRQQ
ncbi:hypothetical protein [uncultured Jannaschia sp.]|uniref:hypothetical protein n=1 Tax=uncultured Jannaschia sp. TaxID=293347 RepID=UPI002607FB6B|nr:hypothetical protein [uncultured Jannaschia sp.]